LDDIYHRLIFDDNKRINVYDYVKDLSENSKIIVINGVSKSVCNDSFRIGWQ